MKNLQKVIIIDRLENYPEDVISFEQLQKLGRKYAQDHPEELKRRIDSLTTNHLLTLVYTSGTTGPPKGAMLTHGNIIWVYHALEDVREQLFEILHGIQIAVAEGIEQLASNIREMKPGFLLGAPPGL